jgi:prolyl oligopeptidase
MRLIFLLAILVAPCLKQVNAQDAAVTKQFQDLLAEEWEFTLREAPTFASHLGDPRFNDRWPDVSLTAIEQRHQHRQETLARLEKIDKQQLSAADQLNYQLFRRDIAEEVEAFPFGWHLVPLDQRGGIQTENELADQLPFRTVKDYDDWIARLKSFPIYMHQTMDLMWAGIRQRIVQPKIVMRRIPEQIKKQIVDEPVESLFYKPFKKFPDEIKAPDQERLRSAAQAAIREHVVPAYREFAIFFDQEYYPACFDEVGAWQLPRGQEFYAFRARQFTTTNKPPDEIHAIGLAEVARIRREMEQIVKDVKFGGSFAEFLSELRTDKKFYYDTPEELLSGYLALCKRVDPELTKLFKTLPRIPYGIEPVPQQIAPDTTTAYYRQPSADGYRPGTFFVNLYRPETRPKYEMEALSLHEAVPGHHLQLALQAELGELPPFRRYGGFTAFIEGWGLYSESLGKELGLYKDPYSKFGQLTYEMWRAIRLVVDTGMHHKKWTRQQAIDLFKENTAKTELDIVNEVDRYIAWPGQALAYKIGELKFKQLRDRAKKQLGDKFDIREFHDIVLRHGAVPLDVLEDIVENWLRSQSQ